MDRTGGEQAARPGKAPDRLEYDNARGNVVITQRLRKGNTGGRATRNGDMSDISLPLRPSLDVHQNCPDACMRRLDHDLCLRLYRRIILDGSPRGQRA